MATKAKWYHIVTLKIRVRTISYANVDSVTTKRPAYVSGRVRSPTIGDDIAANPPIMQPN
jgi:hypothetical protein